jgi:hypothetical protein
MLPSLPSSRLLRGPLAVLAALLTIGAVTASAHAASLTVKDGALLYRAAPGEANYINFGTLDDVPGKVYIDDSKEFSYPAGTCELAFGEPFTAVVCAPQPGGIKVEAGDGVDIVNSGVVPGGGPIAVAGGPGDDVLRGDVLGETFDGGAGVDKITGDGGDDVIHGGGDHDELEGQVGNDQVYGDDGDDTLAGDGIRDEAGHDVIDGGAGYDNVEYDWEVESGHHQPPITITEDGAANDGRPGENDNVTSLEEIYLNAPATLVGDAEADDYTVFNTEESPSTLRGNGGDDKLKGYAYDDTVDGGAGNDTLTGGFGNDTITGGPGSDAIYADVSSSYCNWIQGDLPHGNDTIDVRDGEADQVDCGVGEDTVRADKLDTVSTDCETVVRDGSVPPKQPGTDGPQGPAGPGGSALTAMVHKVKLRKALARGLAVDVAVPAAGKLTATAKANGRTVAKGAALAARADVVTVRVRFTKAGRKALRGARKAKLALALRFVLSAGGAAATGSATVTLKR